MKRLRKTQSNKIFREQIPNFYIVVNLTSSKFAKALQQSLQTKVKNKVLRTNKYKEHNCFNVTPNPLNKIEQFQRFQTHQVSCPSFTTDRNQIGELGSRLVFGRTLVSSTNGRGIIEFNSEDEQPPYAPLYTAYVPKKAEYRVHVFNGEVIDIQQKRKSRSFDKELRDSRIRNVNNGYVYCRDGINPPDGITNLAIAAVNACEYQYGAVDIIYNEKRNQCYVLEVNSRPGLIRTTLDKYTDAIVKCFNLEFK